MTVCLFRSHPDEIRADKKTDYPLSKYLKGNRAQYFEQVTSDYPSS